MLLPDFVFVRVQMEPKNRSKKEQKNIMANIIEDTIAVGDFLKLK